MVFCEESKRDGMEEMVYGVGVGCVGCWGDGVERGIEQKED